MAGPAATGDARAVSAPGGPQSAGAGGRFLRVAMVTTSFPRFPGDFAGHFVARMAEALAGRGHSIEVVAPHAAGLATDESWAAPEGEAIRVKRFRYAPESFERVAYGDGIPTNVRRDPRAAAALPAFVRALQRAAARASRDCDIVHAQWAPTAAFAKSRALNAPVVVTLHGSDVALSERGGIWRRLLERGLRPPTAAVIAVSNELADRLRGSLPADLLPRLSVVHSGIERSLLERARDPRDPAMPVSVAFVGRLLESKGVLDLAEAFAAVSSPARLVVVGDGPARDAMQRILATRGVTPDRVSFLGALDRERALEAMAQADLVVAPSHAEGAGLVAVEASALGTCVLGTRTGIMPEVLDDDQLVGVGDTSALTGALVRLVADEGARRRLAAAARSRVAASFTWDVLAERVEGVYREVLGAREGS